MQLQYNGTAANATIFLPGSKSISNRMLILKEVLGSPVILKNLSSARDTQDLISALRIIKERKTHVIDVGPAGTSMRFLTAFLARTNGSWFLTGSERMKQRPIGSLVSALRELGAEITYAEQEGFPPLKITGTNLTGAALEIDGGISSQFISAILLSAPSTQHETQITLKNNIVSRSYILMTLDLLREFGIETSFVQNSITIAKVKPEVLSAASSTYTIESDWSSASYWFSLVALQHGAKIVLEGLHEKSFQGDSVLPRLYEKLGVASKFTGNRLEIKNISTKATYLEHHFIDCPDIAQTVAVTCVGLNIPCKLTGLSTLKNKETDRLAALKTELTKFGAHVIATSDSLTIKPGSLQHTAGFEIETYGDHRVAMSFAPLAAIMPGVTIKNPSVVEKSYPEFWKHLQQAGISCH